jgi:pimeloyl-ACP methyl ester carboxylesterase
MHEVLPYPHSNLHNVDDEFRKAKELVSTLQLDYQLYSIKGLVGGLYSSEYSPHSTLAVYAIGAPIPPDNGTLPDAPYLALFGVDVFVPDYYGYGRSDGVFTPDNCMKTLTDSYRYFIDGCDARSAYTGRTEHLKYDRIIYIGRSFGANFVALLPKYEPAVSIIALVSPCVDNKSQGQIPGEETNASFMASMREDGYHHLYRGILDKAWMQHLEGKDEYDAMEHTDHLVDTHVYIGHGLDDTVVNSQKSLKYYENLIARFPERNQNYRLRFYSGGHGSSTTNPAVFDFLRWLGYPLVSSAEE